MQHSNAKFGIIMAHKGLTGGSAKNAVRFLKEFTMRENLVCLVIDGSDLKQFAPGNTFRGLIDRKYQKDRFGD